MVLIDERTARQVARAWTGSIEDAWLLDPAAQRGLVDLLEALDRLERTTFRAASRLLRDIRQKNSAGNP